MALINLSTPCCQLSKISHSYCQALIYEGSMGFINEAYDEDAISVAEALAASECYLLRPAASGYTASVYTGNDKGIHLVSLHDLLELINGGVLIEVEGQHGC
ncbi:hypothetical protein [Stenotrophomonas sp. PSU_St142]|nr:hypothetical protein [Stenotrophomonas maltophilia]